jgi:aspartate racemase
VKHIGILAHSFEGASLAYREACLEGIRQLGPHMHPEITLTGVGMQLALDWWDQGDLPKLREMFARDARKLAAAGADFFILPDNTAHIALESDGESFAIPALHIGEIVAEQAARDSRSKVGILGTDWTMTGPVYPGALGRRGMEWAIPDAEDRKLVHVVIFDELCLGVIRDKSRDAYLRIIERLADQGCDAVALVCTEIPLLITADRSPLPILDSTRLLARAAVDVATGKREMPTWRGGAPLEPSDFSSF